MDRENILSHRFKLSSIFSFVKIEWIIAFVSTIAFGLITHLYKYTNVLLNCEGLSNQYTDQNIISSGRWFLSIACGLSSYFDLPWINGLFSIIYVALTSVVIVEIFQLCNKLTIIFIGAILVSFPSFIEISIYEFTADGFMLSMLLSGASVLVLKETFIKNGKFRIFIPRILFSSILLALSCGIYQAYLSFFLVLSSFYFLYYLLNNVNADVKHVVKRVSVCFLSSLLLGVLLYYSVWKICLFIQQAQITNYRGIDSLSIANLNLINSIKTMVKGFINLLLEGNFLNQGINLYGVLNILFIVLFLLVNVISIIKTGLFLKKKRLVVYLLVLILLPVMITIWSFVSPDVDYAVRMMHSYSLCIVFLLIISQSFISKNLKIFVCGLCAIMVINFSIMANIAYYYMDLSMQLTFANACDMRSRILSMSESENEKVAIVGYSPEGVQQIPGTELSRIAIFAKSIDKSLTYNMYHTKSYMKYFLNYDINLVENSNTINSIKKSEEFKSMNCYPYSNSIRKIGDTIVVKFSDN